MENPKQKDVLKHYTTFDVVLKILRYGLKLSDGTQWKDENDRFGISEYSKHVGKRIFVVCLCKGGGNIHHWIEYGKCSKSNDSPSCNECIQKIPCCIEFNERDLRFYIDQANDFYCKEVIYCTFKDLKNRRCGNKPLTITSFPFLKRKEYHIEQEVRIISKQDYFFTGEVFLKNIKQFITKIVIGPCLDSQFKQMKSLIESNGIPNQLIKHNALNNSELWQQRIKQLLED